MENETMHKLALPIVFVSGLLIGGVLSLLLRGLLMQIAAWPHYVPPPVDATPPLEPDEPVSDRVVEQITEILRKYG